MGKASGVGTTQVSCWSFNLIVKNNIQLVHKHMNVKVKGVL